MSLIDIQPGQVWPAKVPTAGDFTNQWEQELYYRSKSLQFTHLVFPESDWNEWEWHGNMVLELNDKWPTAPAWFRNVIVPQDKINDHLIHGYQKLVAGWLQWENFSLSKSIHWHPAKEQRALLLLSAKARLADASVKTNSLIHKKKAFQCISLRQYRLYQHLAALLNDLEPLIDGIILHAHEHIQDNHEFYASMENIMWHAREALSLVGRLDYTPELKERLKTHRVKINRMLGIACLYHAAFLKATVNKS
jgi:hypothetical protein